MKRPDRNNTNPDYWNAVLRNCGLPAALPPLPKKKPRGKKVVLMGHGGTKKHMSPFAATKKR